MDIQAENVEKTIRAVTDICENAFKLSREDRKNIRDHIIQADALKVMKMMNDMNEKEGGADNGGVETVPVLRGECVYVGRRLARKS